MTNAGDCRERVRLREARGRQILFRNVGVARTLWHRTRGLIGRARLAPLEGLWLEPGRSIHTFAMRFPIDCVFLDREGAVVQISSNVPPNRVRIGPRCTRHVLEIPAGAGRRLEIGQRLIRERQA